MIPQTIGALGLFLVLVAPGLVFELWRERKRPALAETAFREASRVALASLFFSVAALGILALTRFAIPDALPSPDEWLKSTKTYVQSNYRVVAGALVAELLLACLLALLTASGLNRQSSSRITPYSAWYNYLQRRSSSDRYKYPFVMVTLKDGDRFFGWAKEYSPENKPEDREIVLQGPLQYQAPSNIEPIEFGKHWKYLILPASSIEYLTVTYLPSQAKSVPPGTDDRETVPNSSVTN